MATTTTPRYMVEWTHVYACGGSSVKQAWYAKVADARAEARHCCWQLPVITDTRTGGEVAW